MQRVLTVFFSMCALFTLAACGNAGEGQNSVNYDVVANKFVAALFAGQFEDAKTITLSDYREDVSEDITQFSNIYSKYELREVKIGAVRGWSPSSPEGDKRIEVGYQYAEKGTENWAIGLIYIRVLTKEGLWGVADLQLLIPSD